MEIRTKSKVKVAVEPSVIIDLFTLIHPKHDIDGKIISALEQGTLSTKDWEGVEYNDLPKLLQDTALGHISNGKYYRLENVYSLLQAILNKSVEIYITPSTFIRLKDLNDIEFEFFNNHIKNLSIRDEDADKIYDIIFSLAQEYINEVRKSGLEGEKFKFDFNKACIVAEASICGLPLVSNDKSLVHSTTSAYRMACIIKDVNRRFGQFNIGIISKKGCVITPTTMTLSSLIKSLQDEKLHLYPDNKNLRTNQEDNTIRLM